MKTKEAVCKRIILSIFSLLVLCRTAGAQNAIKGILSAADAGTCTANNTACSFLTIPSGSGGVTFTITANASGNTIQFEATGDTEPTGSHTWVALNVVPSNGTTAVTSTTSTGTWQANIAGFTQVRLRMSTFVGGTTTTYINLSTASARSNGGGGSVTHTAGNLTAFHLMLGNGIADSIVDSACVTNGTGALSGCTSLSAGSGASAAGATATGGFAAAEAASTGWTPTAGQDYIRADSTLHTFVCSLNGAAEAACATSALSGLTAAAASNTIANVNNPQTWNWAQTTDSQAGLTFGETSAATGGTLTNGLANQAEHSITTATNSTATPFNITQGSITNTVATPAAQVAFTWNNGSLAGRGFGIFATNTASAAASLPLYVNVGNSTLWGVDKTGMGIFNGNASMASTPPIVAASTGGWKFCMYGTTMCTGVEGQAEYHLINNGGNGWLSLSNASASNNAGSSSPDSQSGFSFHNAVFMMMGKGHAGCGFTNLSASEFICGNSSTNEFSAATGGSSSLGMLVRSEPGGGATGCTAVGCVFTGQTATKTIYTLCGAVAGACNQAGQYRITWYFNQTGTACGTPAPGQVTFEISYTDTSGAHSVVALPMNDNSSIAVFTNAFKFAATNVTGFASGEFNIRSTGAQPIQVTNTYTGCAVGTGTWDLTATAERVQ